MSIRFRLALFGLAVVTLTLAVFALLIFGLLAAAGSNEQDRQLAARAVDAVDALAVADADDFLPRRVLAPVDAAEAIDMFVVVLGPDGVPLSGTGEVDGVIPSIPGALLAAAKADGEAMATIEPAPGVQLRIHVRPWTRPDLGLAGYAVAAQASRRVENDLQAGRAFVIAAATFAFLVAGAAIWLVIGRALRPLKQLAALTDEVGLTQDLNWRLPLPRADDEVRRLSESFNGMLDRLQNANAQLADALESQQRFVADASHELRTPLTTIRSNTGFLIQHPDALPDDREAALRDIAGEGERMSRLVGDLLTLARADAGQHLDKAPVDLCALVGEVTRQAGGIHADRHIAAHTPAGDVTVPANADSLTQLLWILIDNAARHTPGGGRVEVSIQRNGARVQLVVADDGEGIPEPHLPHVFDRFFQADAARSGGGAGLGLAIARWIVEEHGGRIVAENNVFGGATLRVELPIAAPAWDAADPGEAVSEEAPSPAASDAATPAPRI
jgi:signal transduction histidine kinase